MDASCGCGDSCGGDGIDRRSFLKAAGLGAAAVGLTPPRAFAGPFTPLRQGDHLVPEDKRLDPAWVASLFERGERAWYSGPDLDTIGMPVGGICAGQVYLSGDGRLISWDIFNSGFNSGYGAQNYKPGRKATEMFADGRYREPPPVAQGAAVRVRAGEQTLARRLSSEGFPAVRFAGEYPLASVEFPDESFPVEVSLEAFSPFIPLETHDSALPATVLRYRVRNRGEAPVQVTLAAWLENASGRFCDLPFARTAERSAATRTGDGLALAEGRIRPRAAAETDPAPREPVVFADFESEGYGRWTAEGEAFGSGPAAGTLQNQNPVSAFKGQRLVNTYLGGNDRLQGRLLSPPFVVERPFIGFLIGGGNHPDQTCINLLVDGRAVRTATGKNAERLEPHNWDVSELAGKEARIEILDRQSGGWGHINIDQIEFRDEPMIVDPGPLEAQPDFGRMALAAVGPGATARAGVAESGAEHDFALEAAAESGPEHVTPLDRRQLLAASRSLELAPGEAQTVTFIYAWWMPNLSRVRNSTEERDRVGREYAGRFPSAAAVAEYVAVNLDRLRERTLAWHAAVYESTLPRWLLDRIGATTCNLATNTCQWWRDGRFWAWEGVGCCHGTCGHVWNYAHTMARLFPELERSVRERQDFAAGIGFVPETGEIRFRGEGWGLWAGDSQGGYVLKAYREHLCSPDSAFLERNWPAIRKATEFLITQDGDGDGLIEGRQHQTYDQDYYGANTMVGSLYLGALRAAEEMARLVGDVEFAAGCRRTFEAGKAKSVERLFNGEYFIQDVDLAKHPEWQYADGCLSDQLFGQSWANQIGLGYLYPPETVHASLRSIWKYNWAPDIEPQNKAHMPERWFAYPGEAGLFTCTWPKSDHLGPRSTRYRNEVWTGIEYQVASHMAWEGMLTEALAICRAVHDRYHPSRRNPFNEIECGDHYARALASWGVLIALSGFEHDGPAGRLAFAPRLTPESFRAPFTGAAGWGQIAQRRSDGEQIQEIALAHGELTLRSLAFELPDGVKAAETKLVTDGPPLTAQATQAGRRLEIKLPAPLTLRAGQSLRVTIALG